MKKFNFNNLIVFVSLFLLMFSSFSLTANAQSAKQIAKQEAKQEAKSCARRDTIVARLNTFQANISNQDKEAGNITAELGKLDASLTGARKNKADLLLSNIASQTAAIESLRIPVLNDYQNLENNLCSGNQVTIKNESASLKNDIANLNSQVTAFKKFIKGDLKKEVKRL